MANIVVKFNTAVVTLISFSCVFTSEKNKISYLREQIELIFSLEVLRVLAIDYLFTKLLKYVFNIYSYISI